MGSGRSVIFNLIATDKVTAVAKDVGKALSDLNTKVNKSLGEAAKKGAAAGGVAAGGAFVAGLSSMIQMDNTSAKLEAQLGITKTKAKEIGGVAGKLYANAYGESMDDVNTAVTSVIQNMQGMGTASNAVLQQTTARAMDVATVMDEDVGNVTKAVAQMMKTGLAKNSQEAFDIITRGAQTGANKAQDLLDTFNEYGTQFRNLGLSGKTAMGLIQQGLQGGARDADLVADAIKEFGLRAINGSATTIAGFKALGLNASQMASQIAAGGPTAAKGLDTVLDRLRGMKDPVDRAAAATNLFGTQSEDLGKALFALDPSKAVSSLGQVGGAADKAGAALGGTAQAKFESFKRTLQQDVQGAMAGTVAWFSKHTTVAKILGGAVATLAAGYVVFNTVAGIMAARTALMTEGTVANTIVTKIAAGATKAWSVAQWLFNAAMNANPISLIIIGLIALGAALYLAFQKSTTFRNAVLATWAYIKTAAIAGWAILKGVLSAIWTFISTYVMPVFRTLWTVVSAVWGGIRTAIGVAWAIIKPIFNVISAVIKGVLQVAFIVLWNAVKIVWIGIQVAIGLAWAIIKVIFAGIKWYISNVLAPIFHWLWNNVIKPVWGFIKQGIAANWAAIKIIFGAIKNVLSTVLGPAFQVFKSVVSAVWGGIKTAMSAVWNNGIRPIFDGLKTALGKIKDAFHSAVDGIKTIWNKLKDVAKIPVNFVIGLYNNGVVKLVNGIAGVAGIKTRLDKIPTFARGGVLPGYAPGRDSLLAAVSPGESIFRPEFTKAVGHGWVHQANDVARKKGTGGVRTWLGTGGAPLGGEGLTFARGGVVPGFAGHFDIGGVVSGWVNKAKDFALGPIEKAAKSILDKVLNVKVPGSGMFHDALQAIPTWIKDHIFGWLKTKAGGAGGPGMQNALNWAKAQSGKPYLWGGVGPGGYDCSGFMSAITNVIHGKSPYSRMFSTHSFDGASGPGGFVRNLRSGFQVGVTNAGVGHMAGTLLGTNVESNGSQGVHYGPGARGATNSLFPAMYGLKADTGALTLQPGWNPPTFNGTGRPELLMTARPTGGGNTYNVNVNVPVGANKAAIGAEVVQAIQAYERGSGKRWRS